MPDVFVRAKQKLLHIEVQPGWTGKQIHQFEETLTLMERFCQQYLPQAVVKAINQVDGSELSIEEVVVIVEAFSPYSSLNVPDIWIDLQCGLGPDPSDQAPVRLPGEGYRQATDFELAKMRRTRIVQALTRELEAYLVMLTHELGSLSYDIEVRPIAGTGQSFADGELIAEWGWLEPK